jgi:hypothetical protein
MNWIERRLADLEAHQQRNAAIRERAVEIYEALWREIVGHVGDAQAKGIAVSTNGAPRKRVVKLGKQNLSGGYWEAEVSLPDSKDRIRAKGDRVDLIFMLDVCPDGVVCLRCSTGAESISIEDAAIAILDPFLFPQLR